MKFFGIPLEPLEAGRIELNPSLNELRSRALERCAVETRFGSIAVSPKIKSRLEGRTEIIWKDPNEKQRREIEEAFAMLAGKRMYQIDRLLGQGTTYTARLYISYEHPEPALIWGSLLNEPVLPVEKISAENSDFITVSIPEFPRQHVYVFPDHNPPLEILLGVDYGGEHKMAPLKLLLRYVKEMDIGIGLHASLSTLVLKGKLGDIKEFNFASLAASGTGKSTVSAHDYGLKLPERAIFRQDDIVVWTHDGRVLGTEQSGFYVIVAGLTEDSQPNIWKATRSKNALFENVVIKDGSPDFSDLSLSKNPRAVIPFNEISNAPKDGMIDARKLDIIVLICRSDGIIPPIMRLSRERAAYEFMMGRTKDTAAVSADTIGQERNLTGWNPFIMDNGSKHYGLAREGNLFLQIARENPRTQFFLVNTGGIGGREGVVFHNISVEETISLILTAIRGSDSHGELWCPSLLGEGYEELCMIQNTLLDTSMWYSPPEHTHLIQELRETDMKWMEQFDGILDPVIMSLCGK